jgi:hypothetical protein
MWGRLMVREAEWVTENLRKVANKQARLIGNKGKPLTPREQYRRFITGAELARVERGEITPEQYQQYQQHWRKKLGLGG